MAGAALLCGIGLLFGCTQFRAQRDTTDVELREESRVLTTGIVDALSSRSGTIEERADVALTLAKQDQKLEGFPIFNLDVESLILSNQVARAELAARFHRQNELLAENRRATDSLINLGVKTEEANNARRLRWFKWGSTFAILIGGLVALCVFFPVFLPIIARLIGWLVSKLPQLASAMGVVSIKAFDAVVSGIEKTKKSFTPEETEQLHSNLSRSMDQEHKRLVRARKSVIT